MTSLQLLHADSCVTRLDPRVRLMAGFLLSLALALGQRWETAVAGLLTAAGVCLAARIPWRGLWPRLAALNGFMLVLAALVPWSVPGDPLWTAGHWIYSLQGVQLAALVTLKGNAILLILSALVSTIDTASLAHALEHLRLPARLIHLLLFTIRYLELMHREMLRLHRAARARGFAAGLNRRTYRTLAQLVGMLLLRSLDRADRVLQAMKARGYCGRFYLLRHFHFRRADTVGAAALALWTVMLIWMEWR